jgi:hypothetical protein
MILRRFFAGLKPATPSEYGIDKWVEWYPEYKQLN